MNDELVVIFRDEQPVVTVKVRNNIFIPSELLDWYAEVYGFERSTLKYGVIRTIDYDIDKDEVRNKKNV